MIASVNNCLSNYRPNAENRVYYARYPDVTSLAIESGGKRIKRCWSGLNFLQALIIHSGIDRKSLNQHPLIALIVMDPGLCQDAVLLISR